MNLSLSKGYVDVWRQYRSNDQRNFLLCICPLGGWWGVQICPAVLLLSGIHACWQSFSLPHQPQLEHSQEADFSLYLLWDCLNQTGPNLRLILSAKWDCTPQIPCFGVSISKNFDIFHLVWIFDVSCYWGLKISLISVSKATFHLVFQIFNLICTQDLEGCPSHDKLLHSTNLGLGMWCKEFKMPIPWLKEGRATHSGILPGESYGQSCLAGRSP